MSMNHKLLAAAVLMALGATAQANPLADQARALMRSKPAAVRAAPEDNFILRDSIRDADGTEHVRFDRTWRGLPVIGGDVVVHQKAGRFRSASLGLGTTMRPTISPRIKPDAAQVEAGAKFGGSIDAIESFVK